MSAADDEFFAVIFPKVEAKIALAHTMSRMKAHKASLLARQASTFCLLGALGPNADPRYEELDRRYSVLIHALDAAANRPPWRRKRPVPEKVDPMRGSFEGLL